MRLVIPINSASVKALTVIITALLSLQTYYLQKISVSPDQLNAISEMLISKLDSLAINADFNYQSTSTSISINSKHLSNLDSVVNKHNNYLISIKSELDQLPGHVENLRPQLTKTDSLLNAVYLHLLSTNTSLDEDKPPVPIVISKGATYKPIPRK